MVPSTLTGWFRFTLAVLILLYIVYHVDAVRQIITGTVVPASSVAVPSVQKMKGSEGEGK